MTPDERAALEALADRWGATHWPIHAQQLRAVLAAHPDTPAPTDLLDRFPAPVLPEGAVPLAEGWHVKYVARDRKDLRPFALTAPDGEIIDYYDADELATFGQPVPEPAPTITVGCIVRTRAGNEVSIEAIVLDQGWAFTEVGKSWGSYPLSELSFVAPSREACGWPPIEETA